jgi:hypothetical protein
LTINSAGAPGRAPVGGHREHPGLEWARVWDSVLAAPPAARVAATLVRHGHQVVPIDQLLARADDVAWAGTSSSARSWSTSPTTAARAPG